jgi:hypothetical protein
MMKISDGRCVLKEIEAFATFRERHIDAAAG